MSNSATGSQRCVVYKSLRKADTYVYLWVASGPAALPEALRHALEPLARVMEIDLSVTRKLARVDIDTLAAALDSHGYYLQLPPA